MAIDQMIWLRPSAALGNPWRYFFREQRLIDEVDAAGRRVYLKASIFGTDRHKMMICGTILS